MNRKEILTIILLICVIFSLQAVVAADSGSDSIDSDVLSVDNVSSYALPSSNIDTLAEVANADSFNQLAGNLSGASEVSLIKNYTYKDGDSFSNGIEIDHDIVIDGQGKVTIDANNQARIFKIVNGATVTLKGITFINGNTASATDVKNGGSILVANGMVNIIDCTFKDNTAYYGMGGAVCLSGSGGNITNSYFEGNRAINNPGTENTGGAGAVFINANNTNISHSEFINNWAGLNGGAVGSSGNHVENCTITNCTFTSNIANGSAGGVGMQSRNFHIYNSTFKHNEARGNYATNPTYPGNGGGMVMRGWDSYAYNCTFINNTAAMHGGAAYLTNTTYNPLNNNTGFVLCIFTNNTAGYNGGAVDWHAGATHGYIEDCTFTNNTAKRSGGAVHWSGHYGSISNSTFTGNNATGEVTSTIAGITGGGDGGAVVWVGSHGIINESCVFTNNYAANRGGAVFLHGNSTENCTNVTVHSSTFEYNTAGTNGGALDWHSGAHDGSITNSTFRYNVANANGGAVYWRGHHGDIISSNFTNNTAKGLVLGPYGNKGDGGAVLWAGINGTVENCWFTNNTAARNGGAVYLENCSHGNWNTTFSHSHFINNTAGYNGGAIYYHEGAHDGKISYSEFINNTAKRNGGAIFWNGYNGTVKNSRFENNRATGTNWEHTMDLNMGDTIVVNNDGSLTLGNIIVIQSDKLPTPTDISIYKDNLVVLNSTSSTTTYYSEYYIIVENSTGGKEWKKISESEAALNYTLTLPQGNITNVTELPDISSIATSALNNLYILNISVSTSIAHFESWVVIGNDTAGYEWKQLDEINITVSESIISPVDWAIDQYYGGDGGTILWSGDVGLVENCTFIDSNSARRGGGAYMTSCDNVSYINCYFENCTSGTNGGGVDWLAGANYGKIYNCTFNNTRAARSAGAIYYDGWYGDMQNITIVNTQSWGGALKQSKDKLVNYAGWDSSHWDTNTTGGDAGAIMYTGSFITVYNVTFTNCNASGRGGAVFLQDNHNVTFDLCTFENNIASGTAHNTYNDDKDISSGLNTWLTGYGGAIAFDVGATNGTIKNSKFTNNTAIRLGGAISFGKGSANAHVWNSTFDNNTAYRNGGAIAWDGTNGKMEDCNFTNNSALGTDINRGIFDLTSLSQIKNVTSISEINSEDYIYILVTKDPTTNKATLYEMYVYKNNTAIKLEETTETGPSPTDWTVDEYFGGDGGTIYWRGDKGIVDNCRFIGSNSARRGGGAYMAGSDNITFQNSYFFNCTSGTNGGGLDWLAGANYGKVINCTFEETCAVRSAGAIYYDGDYGEFRDIVVKNTHTHGGELESKNDLVNYAGWDASHWDTNTTGGDGGAIMLTGDHIYIYNATFINCTASGRGGAVFLQDNNNVTLELCTFENNRALGIANNTYNDARDTSSGLNKWYTGNGGAIAFDKGASNGTIISSKFINNTAARNGGAVSFSVNSTNAYIFNSSFTNNTAKRSGGALDWDGTNGNISYCNFTQNHALGTAISTEYANITSLNDVIAKNGDTVSALGKPSIATDNKLYVLVVSEGGKKVRYELYVSQVADLHYWLKIDETTETSASPVDWAIDEYFGGDGGSIYWSGDNATIDHCNFLDSNSARRGGGAYMTGGDHVSYVNCTFENCTSGTNGGGLDWLAGANYGKVVDCNFTNTQAARSAGAIYYDGDYGEFTNIIIRNATAHGGDLYECKDGKVKYAGWDSSHWDTNTTGGDAGAIMLTGDHIKLYNVNVTDCTAVGRGGAVFVQDNHNVTFELCRFENNRALGTANNTFNDPYDTSSGINHNLTGHGGAISFDIGATESSIIDSTFINNTAVLYGGAVHFREGASEDKIINSTFEKNHANEDGGALYMDGDDCELHNSTFTSNYAGDDGGAINWKGDVGTIYNITCVNNSGISSHGNSKGGTVCLNGNNITLSNSSFKQSYAKVAGGAIFVTGNYVNITDSEFKDCNVTTETGGAIQIVGNHVEVRDSTFEECHAPNGGAIYAEGQYVKIIDSNFTNNNVTKDGAALYVNGDYSELHNSTFKENIAGDDGGAIYWQGAHGTINNITCENNHGISSGDSNSNGGTICITGNDITLSNSTFKNSSAGAQGGAIFVTGNNVNILTSEFESCNSTGEGGAIYVLGDDTTISESTFENCNATQGGAIYVEGNRATISVNITDTHATGADAYAIVVDYKLYKDNVKEIKYDINNTIEYVADIKVDGTFTNETLTDLNTTLKNLYGAVDNILTADGINMTNVTKALDIVHQLNATLIQLNASLPEGKDKNITLQLITDIQNIGNELNYLIDISKTLEVPDSITVEIGALISEVRGITTGAITVDNKTDLLSTLNGIRSDVEKILNGNTFNATNIEHALKLLNNLTDTLKELNATLPSGDDKNTVIKLMGEVKDIENQLNGLSDMVVVPEVVSRGGAIYISGNNTLIDNSVINSTDALYGGGLYIAGHDVKVDNSEFINLYSGEDGGAIYITGLRGQLYNSKFINNTAGDDGGAINWDGNYGKIYNITCESNRGISLNGSSSNGGTIALTGNDTSIEKSRFSQTYALISGGAIFVTGNNVNITDSQFKDCNVSMNISDTHKDYANGGGAIYLFGNSSNVVNCTFDNSEAREGGAIYVQGNDAKIDKSNFTDSSALNGGTIYIDGDHAIVKGCMLNNTIAGNDSHSLFDENLNVSAFKDGLLGKGGAIYIRSENAQILDSTITSSYTTHEGGAIYVEGNNATISVDFIECGAGFPVAWVSPDRDLFKPLISNVLIRVNGLIAYNNDIHNGFSDNFTDIYNSLYFIRNSLVNKIFDSKKVFHKDMLDAAIGNLTELYNAIPHMVTDSNLLTTLNLSSLINSLLGIPDNANYDSYYASKVKPVLDGLNTMITEVNVLGNDNNYLYKRLNSIKTNLVDKIFDKNGFHKDKLDAAIGNLTEFYNCVKFAEKDGSYDEFLNNITQIITSLSSIPSTATSTTHGKVKDAASNSIASLRDYSRSVKNAYVDYKNNLDAMKTNLNNLDKQTTLRSFNRLIDDIMVNVANIEADLNLLLDAYAGSDFTELSNNFTYVKSQLELIQNAGESLQNLGVKGGAIYVAGNDTNITGSTFLRCLASNALKGEGGAIYITGLNTTITGSEFMDCSAPDNGGSIYVSGKNTRVENSTFNKTSAEIGGAIYILGSETTIDGSSFVDSSADYRGGAIYIEGLNAHVKYSNFTDSAVTGGIFNNTNSPRGGAIYIKENNAVVEGSIFNNSAVSTSVGEGGAIYIEGDYAKILSSEFENSNAKTGGAIYLEGDSCNVTGSTFTYSHAYENGGAMYSTGSRSTVYKSNFTNNLAELSGGAVYWYGGSKSKYNTVDRCNFTNNTAHGNTTSADVTRGGGAIYWSENGEYGTVKHSKFYYNSVQSTIDKKVDGGAILWDKSKHALVDNCTFVGNFVITNGDTSGTTASAVWAQGGAMYLRPTANYTVRNCHFENCSSSKEAGALYIQGQTSGTTRMILLENSVFINNVAYAKGQYNINGGGAIQIKQCTQSVFNNLTFINNTANKGGALSVFDSVTYLEVNGANFTGNKAEKGSAISASKGFTLKNAVLLENRANTTIFNLDFNRAGSTIDILLEGWDTHLNAMYIYAAQDKTFNVTFNNVTYWTNNNISIGKTSVVSGNLSSVDVKSVREKGISITVELFDANNNKLNEGNDIFATDEDGKLHLIPDNFGLTSFNDVYVVARLTNEDYYTQIQNTTRLPVTMEAIADNVTYHRNATVHVTITPTTGSPAANGTVSVYYEDVFLGNITVNNNVGVSDTILTNITADKFLEVGKYNLTLKYWGDLYNDAVNITVPINVTKAQSNITFAFGEIGYDLMVNLTIVDDWNDKYYADATGNVTVEVYGSLSVPIQTRTVYLVNGTGLAAFDLLPANYTIKATYNGDKNYNASVNSTPAELHKKHDIRILIELNATAGDIMVDETVYINIKILTPEGYNATGNVSLYLDNEKYILPLNATSQASFNKTGLSAGHKIVTVCYDGSEDLQANYGEASFNVLKYNTTFTINVTNITHNQKEIINITFANETEGVVYIFVNDRNYSAPIHNRTAILELSNLTVGEHNVTVKFPGDWTFNNVTNMTRFYVEKVAPEIIINVDNVTYGDPTKIIINVPDCVSGDVSIKIDGTPNGTAKPIVNGKVEFDLGNLNAGEYTVEAIYSGDTNHTGTSKEQKFKVYKANRTVEIDVQNIVHGAVEHITVHVNATGNVTIRVNGKSETITLNNGVAELDVYNLTANTYTVDVTYNGNDNYNKSSASKEFVVAKMTTSLDVQVHDVLVRGMEYINITVKNSTGQVAKDLNGTLTLNIDGVNRAVKIVNGTATFYSSEFNSVVGKRVVWAFFEGNVNFTESKAMNTYQVNTRTLNDNEWNVTAKDIYVGQDGNITVLLPSDVTGFLDIEVKAYPGYGDRDDTYYAKPVNGKAVLNPKDLKEGKYHVYVTYMGTDYEESYLDTFFTVSKFPTTIEVSVVSPITDGDDAIITVTMTPDINGTVELTVGDKIYYVAVVNGTGRYVVNNLANGTYAIKAIFAGDTQYFGKTSNTAILEVNMIPTGLSISIDKTSMNITDNAVVSIELLDKSGNVIHTNAVVTVKVNGNNHTVGLVNGKGSFTLSGLDNDTYIITAVFAGVDKYMQSISNTLTLDVIRLTPKVNVSATNRSVDETVTITVSIPANATGYVVVSGNFTDNEIYIANSEFTDGVATIDVAGLANGTYSVHITYYGLDNDPYAMSVNDTNFTVSKLNATVRIDVNDTIYDNNVNIIVYVDNGVEGTITIKLNNTDLGTYGIVNGKVNITVDNPGAEKYTVYAIYNGNYKYNVNNTASKDFTVERATPVITIDSVTVDANTSAVIKVHINSTATGKMNITVNRATYTADIIDGVATFNNIPVLPVGEYDITANYYALTDTNYTVGSATLGNGLNVTKVKCYPINISTVDVKAGEETTITVYVPVDATGKVYIEVNGTKLNKTVSGGKAEFKVTKEIEGRYVVNATFVDDKYANKTILGNYYVNYADTVMGIDIAEPVYVNDTAVITVTVPAGITGKVTIEINGKSYTNKTVTAAGIVFEVPKITYGNKTVVAIYSGDSKYIANSTTKNFTVIKHDSKVNVTAIGNAVGSNATISVNVTDTATGYVVVNVNGTNYTINLTGSCGSVQIAGLKAGTYYVHATYIGDDKYKSSINNTQTFTMVKSDVIMNITVDSIEYGQKANITVNITSDATGFITISINNTRNVTLPIVDGKVNWIVEGLGVENYTVYANYSGDGKYNINDTSETFNVTKATPTITIESVDVNSARNATVVVHITPETTGFINITVNGENYSGRIDNGVAKIIIKQLNAGNYSVFANYTGDWNFTKASINQTNRVNVYKYSCYAMNVTAADTKVGVNTTITVNVPEDAVGKVVIYVNNTWAGNATISHGVATLELNRTISGKYVVNATFGDAKYANKTVTTNFHVVKWDTPMNITVKDAKVGDTVQIIVSVPQDITGGTVTIEINGKKYTNVTDNKGNATFYVENVTYGNKTVTAIYNGNNKYVFNSTTQNFTVTKRNSYVNVTASASVVGLDAVVNVTIPANATGYVIVNINGTDYAINTTDGNGSVVIKNLGNGKYTVNATYIGDDQYLSSTNATDFTILRSQPTFAVNGTDITYGAKELIKFESVENITAPIKVEINGRNYTAFIIEGKGNLTVENLAAGKYNVTIYFAGNNKYLNATANNTFTVEKGVMPIYVIAQNITYSEESVFTIYVNATGKVDIYIYDAATGDMVTAFGNIEIIDYKYTLPVFLDSGNYTVRVEYKGNENYTNSSAKANFTVFKKDPTIAIEVQNITYGGVEHIIVRVNAEGNVTIKVNGTEETIVLREDDNAVVILRAVYNTLPNYDGKAHEYIYNLNVGEYPVEVTFNGNENYNRATANARFFVNADNTTVHVDVDDIVAGGKETINVTISNKNATGNVTINVDGVNYTRPITNGTANLTLTNLAAGNHSVVVIYEGDNNFAGNWTSATFNVTKVKPAITVDANDTSAGKVAKIIVNLPDNATGFVVIDVDGTKYHVDIVPGQEIAIEVDNLLNKTYHVTAEYSGDEYWDAADNSTSFNVNITKADISVKVENITVGDMAIINITTPKELYGNVTVNVDDKNYTVYVAGGNGILVVPGLDVGNYTVNVTFAGTDRFGPNNATAKLEVSKVNMTSDDIKVIDQGNGTVAVVVGGNATGNVTVYVDGKNFTGEIVNGTAVITLENVTPGVNDIEVVYSGDDKHSNSTVNGTVTIPRLDTEFDVTVDEGKEGENTTITVKVPKDATGNVTVTIDGQKYTAEIDNGTAVITVENLTAGDKTALIEYAGDANYTSNYTTT